MGQGVSIIRFWGKKNDFLFIFFFMNSYKSLTAFTMETIIYYFAKRASLNEVRITCGSSIVVFIEIIELRASFVDDWINKWFEIETVFIGFQNIWRPNRPIWFGKNIPQTQTSQNKFTHLFFSFSCSLWPMFSKMLTPPQFGLTLHIESFKKFQTFPYYYCLESTYK